MDSSSFKTSLGKKLIAVALCVTAFVFLSISVFADTPVQPLQVVTYSDTTTNVRISGTAERLHYNIDSFQVVFMSPPNNYGTSCTPVLVSFRFYNSSELPAYVGQAEFELTATTGTGNINTIIYGYDQISTDLFVAESSYSTAEVGRIGIGASNDFAYYTGFVIPPKTSLYFSCIVYVNASAYAQNNTGATEDVNQVTLSSLNLYTNQISFSADYPYHGEPIDFSSVIEAIENSSNTGSDLYTLINSFKDYIQYTGSVPSVPYAVENLQYTNERINVNYLDVNAARIINAPIISNMEVHYDSVSDTTSSNIQYYIDVDYIVRFVNRRNKNINIAIPNIQLKIENINGSGNFQILEYNSNLVDGYYIQSSSGNRIIEFYPIFKTSTNQTVLCNGYGLIEYKVRYFFSYNGTNPTYNTFSLNDYFLNKSSISFTDESTLFVYGDNQIVNEINITLKKLYDAYSSVNGLDDIDDTASDITNKSESAHTQEQTYFTQNAQAIQQTGLSNYRFSSDQENGISSVSHDFILLWNALGGFNSIYVFSLTLSLALMILRHAPGAISSYQAKQRAEEIKSMFKKGKH